MSKVFVVRMIRRFGAYIAFFGGLILTTCASPPLQYVGAALFIAALVHATIESHCMYHPRKKKCG